MVNLNALAPREKELLVDSIVSGSVEVTTTDDYRAILRLRSFGLVQSNPDKLPELAHWKPTEHALTVAGNSK